MSKRFPHKHSPPSKSFSAARVTGVLEHAEPGFDLRNPGAFISLDASVVRALHEAARSGTCGEGRVPEQP